MTAGEPAMGGSRGRLAVADGEESYPSHGADEPLHRAIAATTLAKGYGVATENTGDFRAGAVTLVNPFDRGTWGGDFDDDPLSSLSS